MINYIALINTACEDQIKASFRILITNLSGGDDGHALGQFLNAVKLAEDTRDRVLSVLIYPDKGS
jgi:hypothetical protein